MNKKIKRGTALLTSAVLLLGAMPMDTVSLLCPVLTASAEETAASGTCGDKLTWTLDENGTLSISGSGQMTEFHWDDSAFAGNSDIYSVVIENGVTNISSYAFEGCRSLTSITLPDSVTSIGKSAFGSCSNLSSIVIPDSVTTIGDYVFAGCESLTSISIPDSVTSIGDYAFYKTPWLEESKSKYHPFFIVNGILIDGKSCSENAVIPDNVTSISGAAFGGNRRLTNITIPNTVKYIGTQAFANTRIGSVSIPNSITKINDNVFNSCSSLSKIEIPNSVTSIGDGAFAYCINLTTVNIPNSVISIGCGAFSGCTNLSSIIIPPSVTNIDNASFGDCEYLIIKGCSGSYAETYAKEHNIPFEAILLGDVTGDGEISIADAQLALNAYVDIMADNASTLTAEQLKAADVNGDNVVSVEDAQFILMYYVQNTVADKPTTWEEVLNQET